MAELIIHIPGALTGRRVKLSGTVTVGRDAACEVAIADEQISKQHFQLLAQADQRYRLKDLGSRNGTFVNGERQAEHLLVDGDELYAGQTRLIFVVGRQARLAPQKLEDSLLDGLGATTTAFVHPNKIRRRMRTEPSDLAGYGPRAADALRAIYQMVLELPHIREDTTLARRFVHIVRQTLEPDAICLFNREGQLWCTDAADELALHELCRLTPPLVEEVLATQHSQLLRRLAELKELQPRPTLLRSLATWPLPAQGGEVAGVLVVANGVHKRLLTAEDLRFGEAVCTVAGSLLTNVRLLGRMEKTIQLVQVATHDFRSPLQRLMFIVERQIDQLLEEEQRPHTRQELGQALDVAADMGRLLDDILSHEAIEAGRVAIRAVPVDLPPLLRRLVRPYQTVARYQHRRFEVELTEPLPPVQADPSRLEQMVGNLLQNAFRYSGDKGTVRLQVGPTPSGEAVEMRVEDSGPGIPEADRDHIFQPFTRATPQAQASGRGLGLAIVSNLVRLHGGRIHVEESPAGGAAFVIRLPVRLD